MVYDRTLVRVEGCCVLYICIITLQPVTSLYVLQNLRATIDRIIVDLFNEYMDGWLSWLEFPLHTREVGGSSPPSFIFFIPTSQYLPHLLPGPFSARTHAEKG